MRSFVIQVAIMALLIVSTAKDDEHIFYDSVGVPCPHNHALVRGICRDPVTWGRPIKDEIPKCGSKQLKRILDPFTYSLRCGP